MVIEFPIRALLVVEMTEKPKMSWFLAVLFIFTHNPKVGGSNPPPATNQFKGLREFPVGPFCCVGLVFHVFTKLIISNNRGSDY
jgi:hypothetical protein